MQKTIEKTVRELRTPKVCFPEVRLSANEAALDEVTTHSIIRNNSKIGWIAVRRSASELGRGMLRPEYGLINPLTGKTEAYHAVWRQLLIESTEKDLIMMRYGVDECYEFAEAWKWLHSLPSTVQTGEGVQDATILQMKTGAPDTRREGQLAEVIALPRIATSRG